MPIAINWATKVITIPQADLTYVSGSLYELDVNAFRLALKDIEDSEEGAVFPDTHRHNTEVVLSGVTYARSVEIINGYTVTFQDVGSPYRVRCVGANHNISDVQNLNNVSLIVGNAAGLIVKSVGSGLSVEEHDAVMLIDEVKAETDKIQMVDENIDLLMAFIRNKKYLEKQGPTWFLTIRNAEDTTDILKKALKDKNGSDITDIQAGIMAQELASSV